MQRIKISSTLEMSRLVYGMWRLGDDEDTSPHHVPVSYTHLTLPTKA